MDFLTAEINRKRKELSASRGEDAPASKYVRRRDLEEAREQSYRAKQEALEKERAAAHEARLRASVEKERQQAELWQARKREAWEREMARVNEELSETELQTRLRAADAPIRLFGESLRQRKARLRVVEEEKAKQVAREEREAQEMEQRAQENGGEQSMEIELRKIKDESRTYRQLQMYMAHLLHEWEAYVGSHPEREDMARSLEQAQINLQPLLVRLRERSLKPDILRTLATIIYYCQQREYVRANDAYLKLSIGNAPWPIGLKDTGIHARSADDRITTKDVANVLVDEATRKWLQSVKRCLTFAQTRWPPEDPSLLMG